jgi:hypothetical protein
MLGSKNTHAHKHAHSNTDVVDTEKEEHVQKKEFSFFLFKDDVSCEVLNDQNEQKLDHKICTQMA